MSATSCVDLFAGAGGLGIGAAMAGADVRLSVEFDATACETLKRNATRHLGRVEQADVTDLSGEWLRSTADVPSGDRLLVIGGPPCQPFSKASYWLDPGDEARYRRARATGNDVPRPSRPNARVDPRRRLLHEFLRLTLEATADAFVLENVPSLLHPRNRGELEVVERLARDRGYGVTLIKADAADFGVAQHRRRVFLVGIQGGVLNPSEVFASAGVKTSVSQAIGQFSGSAFFEPEEVVTGRWARHLLDIPPGSNYKFHTEWAGHPTPTFIAETRYWNFLLKLDPHKPSWTIAANPGPWTGPFHWESRRLRTSELAALQGFPPDYVFVGSRRDRVQQIGNAVPPPLAAAVVAAVLRALDHSGRPLAHPGS
jgi:DNA (cytosine-5)-methyltransferase 1